MVDRLNQQLKKGVFEILVLKLINEEDLYGYELLNRLETESHGTFKLKEGSLYPILYRLEDKGFIESYRKNLSSERKVPRKYYRITETGNQSLQEMIASWNDFKTIIDGMLSSWREI